MPNSKIRFLHSGDLRLEQVLEPCPGGSPMLESALAEAPFRAAQRVFQIARDKQVDFVLFTGDLLDPALASPRALSFLQREFEHLNRVGIAVYWASTRADLSEQWPGGLSLPENVRLFAFQGMTKASHCRGQVTVCHVYGRSGRDQESSPLLEFSRSDNSTAPAIAVFGGTLQEASVGHPPFKYVGVSGGAEFDRFNTEHGAVVCAGSPQGIGWKESGLHGCVLAEVDESGKIDMTHQTTDAIRWYNVAVELTSPHGRELLLEKMRAELLWIKADNAGVVSLVSFQIETATQDDASFVYGERQKWLDRLQEESGDETVIWPVKIDVLDQSPLIPNSQSTLGESVFEVFRNVLMDIEQDNSSEPEGASTIGLKTASHDVPAALLPHDKEQRERLVREVSGLGAALLEARK